MTTEPTLGALTKVRIGAFATEMAASHPAQAKTIFTLQETLEQRLPVAVQNQIIEKLNRDPKGTLAAAKELINKDPKILDEVNKDPLKLATIMGVSVPAAAAPAVAANAPAKPIDNKVAAAPAAAANAPSSGKPAEARPAPVAVVATPAVAAKPPISDSELALRTELGKETVKVTKMPGFEEFAARAEKSQSLGQAVDAMMGKNSGSTQGAIAALKDIQKDPDFFVKANKGIDEIPVQMRDNVFSQIAENPQLGRQALGGDQGAKMTLTMGAMFGGAGGGGFANLFGGAGGGQGLKGFGEMLANLLPKLLEGIKMAFANIFKGNTQFAAAPGLMRMGNEPLMIGRYANSVDTTLGTDSSKKPVIDAANPDKPAMTVSDLRKLEIQQGNQPDATPAPGTPAMAQLDRKLQQQGPGQTPGTSFA